MSIAPGMSRMMPVEMKWKARAKGESKAMAMVGSKVEAGVKMESEAEVKAELEANPSNVGGGKGP